MFYAKLFKLRETNRNVRNKYKLNLNITVVNQVNYGSKSLRVWNSPPHHAKSAENLETFKKFINYGMACLVTVLFIYIYTYIHTYTCDCVIYIHIYIYTYSPSPWFKSVLISS